MLGKLPTLGVLFFPDGSPKTCVGSLWCGVHWSGASGWDSEWQVTNTRREQAQPSAFHERIPEASVWLWAKAGAAGLCSQLQLLAAFGCRGSHRQVGSWRHPHGSINSLPIRLLLQLWEKGRMPGILFEEVLPKKKGWVRPDGSWESTIFVPFLQWKK